MARKSPKDQITTEYFKSGTEPTMVSPRYMKLDNVQKRIFNKNVGV